MKSFKDLITKKVSNSQTNAAQGDGYEFKDSSKKPNAIWIMAGVGVVCFALLIQIGMRVAYAKATTKSEMLISEEKIAPELDVSKLTAAKEQANAQLLELQKELEESKRQLITKSESRSYMPSPRTIANAVVKEPDPFLTSQVGVNIGVIENHGSPKSIGQSNHVESKSDDQVYQENENTLYQKQLAKSESKTMVATAIRDLDYKILQGKIIKGVLETAIVSDLPGMIRGHVTEDVYGEQGDVILIPNGSRLIGQYRSGRLKAGDSRVFVVWQRIIEPNGITIDINSSGSDDLGRAGLSGKVNNHFLQRFGSATLMSIISAGAATAGVHPNDQYNSEAAYRQALSQAFAQTASGELEQNIRIQPTININQGKPITILANQDVSFLQVMKEQS